jgi:nondiscriminating glutamyl-tRNA synthetase
MASVHVRFSPAPTGMLHVGGARTALFNWLFARHHGGRFSLRIEDTDRERSRPEWVEQIQDTLRWLGLDWDGDPVRQSARFDLYLAAVDRLLASGHAYEAFETPEELEAINEQARAEGRPPGYDGRARALTDGDRARLRAEGRPRTVRFRTPDDGVSTFHDVIRGAVSVEWRTVSDFIIVRSDGTPTFPLANAVDDAEMGITHVIRGEDLIDSTHRVLAIREALAYEGRPEYAHLPLIVGDDRAKLSKRHGAVALDEFKRRGYLPEALVNYLALLGWSPGGDREILSLDEIVAAFDLDDVTHSAAAFDYAKLEWMNGEYIRAMPVTELVDRVRPYAVERYGEEIDGELLAAAVALAQERATTLVSIAEQAGFLFTPDAELEIEPASWQKLADNEHAAAILDVVIAHVEQCEWTPEAIGEMRAPLADLDVPRKARMAPIFAAVQGSTVGLPLFDAIHLLGRESALARLRRARERLA